MLMEVLYSMEDLLLQNAIRSKKKDFVRGRNIYEVCTSCDITGSFMTRHMTTKRL